MTAFELPGGPPPVRLSKKAIASLILGVLSPIGVFVTGLPAVVLGVWALRDIRTSTSLGGKGVAVAGACTGGLFALTCGSIVVAFVREPVMAYVQDARSEYIVQNATWRWLHPTDGADPAISDTDFHATYHGLDYDDSSWHVGEDLPSPDAGFGYGDDDIIGTNIGIPSEGQRFSAYFRHIFMTQTSYDRLYLTLQRDDGVIVYLDGAEVGREHMDDSPDHYKLLANRTVNDNVETRPTRIQLKGRLTPGRHVLAISLHNHDETTSSDLRIAKIVLRGRRSQ